MLAAFRAAQLALAEMQASLDPAQLAVRRVQEVARAAGRIEHNVVHEIVLQAPHIYMCRRCIDPLVPGVDDGRLDDLLDVGLVCVVRAQGVLRLGAKCALEEGAEDVWLDRSPVVLARETQDEELLDIEVDLRGLGEKRAIDISRLRVQPSRRSRTRTVSQAKRRPRSSALDRCGLAMS